MTNKEKTDLKKALDIINVLTVAIACNIKYI